jgi:cell division septum initiation protein DivIVA
LQCDVRTTETSSGAALVDESASLVGIIVATAAPEERAGWTYAVPVRYVQRLLQAKAKVLPMPPQPVLGCTLGPGAVKGSLVVEHVNEGGPADLAGIRKGDIVKEFDGLQLRNVYQAVGCIDQKQPGETITVSVEQDGRVKQLDIVLGVAPEEDAVAGPQQALPFQIGSQIKARKNAANQLILENLNRGTPQIVETNEDLFRQTQNANEALRRQGQVDLARLVSELEARLQQQEADRLRTDEELKRLTLEVQRLRKQIAPQRD